MSLTDFLLARIAEDEESARVEYGRRDVVLMGVFDPERILAECKAKRAIVEQHQQWPVFIEGPQTFDQADPDDISSIVFRVSRQMAWLTEQEYRARFGDEPPTAPMIRTLAAVYADHEDYRQEWAA